MPPYPSLDRARRHLDRQRAVALQAVINRVLDHMAQAAGIPQHHLVNAPRPATPRAHPRCEVRLAARARTDRALAQVRRRRDAYFRTLYRSVPQRLVLGLDAGTDPASLALVDAADNRLLWLAPTHHVRRLPDGQVDETHTFPPGTLPLLHPRLPADSLTITNADRARLLTRVPQPRTDGT
ncbi:hypothetical protein RM863_35220 [Streptomyces sp. DSM 41014]|uniref:Transposase n=1 Tax=Streptomyces hintoniae TaxID=3075521 RepID=A0ABU2UVS7_9ACTN|nr:hypothetical protein [Streptomyces sp. DSM 41014]MDT0477386.1 hypothetical protein [Streptomyces sp. DSM 41014]